MGSLKNKLHACEMILKYLESFKSRGAVFYLNLGIYRKENQQKQKQK